MSSLLSPLEWVFVIILAIVPLAGLAFHLWVMFQGGPRGEAKRDPDHGNEP